MLVTTITNFRSPNRLSIYTNLSQWYKIWGMAYEKWKLMFIFPLPVSFVDAERCSDAFFSVRGSVWFVWQLPSHPGISLVGNWCCFRWFWKFLNYCFLIAEENPDLCRNHERKLKWKRKGFGFWKWGHREEKNLLQKKTFTARWKPNSLCNQSAVAESRKRLRLAVTSSAH